MVGVTGKWLGSSLSYQHLLVCFHLLGKNRTTGQCHQTHSSLFLLLWHLCFFITDGNLCSKKSFPKVINFVFKDSLRFLPTALAVDVVVVVTLEFDLVVVVVARAFDLYFFLYDTWLKPIMDGLWRWESLWKKQLWR